MKQKRKLRKGTAGGGPDASISEVKYKAASIDDHIEVSKDHELPVPDPLTHKKRAKESEVTREKSRSYLSHRFVLSTAFAIILLSIGGALIIYFSNPQEDLQRMLMETFIITWTMGVSAIIGFLVGCKSSH